MGKKLDLEPLDLEPIDQEEDEKTSLDLEPVENSLPIRDDKPGYGEAVLRSLGQGSTFGFGDEAVAAMQAGLDVATSDKKISDLKQLYETYKDLQREREAQVKKAYPKTYLAGEIAGSLPTMALPGGQVNTAGKAAKLGALMGFGKSEGDITRGEIGEAAKDTGLGALLGLLGYGTGKVAGKIAEKTGLSGATKELGEKASRQAEDMALSTLGTDKRALEQEIGQSLFTPADQRKGIGREILESRGIFTSPGALKEKLAGKITDIEGQKAPLLASTNEKLQTIRSYPTAGELEQIGKNPLKEALTNIKNKIIEREAKTTTNPSTVQNLDDRLTETIQRYSSDDFNIEKLNDFKKLLNQTLSDLEQNKRPQDLPVDTEFIKQARDAVNKRLQELADVVEPSSGQLIKEMGRKENILYDATKLAKNAQIKELGKEADWSPWKIIGSQVDKAKIATAKGLDLTGKKLVSAGEMMESATPGATVTRPVLEETKDQKETKPLKLSDALYSAPDEDLQDIAGKLEQNEKFSNYGKSLRESIESKNNQKKNAILFSILQNPNLRKLFETEE